MYVFIQRNKNLNQTQSKRVYHDHTLQTNPRHREEGPQNTNSHKTPGR